MKRWTSFEGAPSKRHSFEEEGCKIILQFVSSFIRIMILILPTDVCARTYIIFQSRERSPFRYWFPPINSLSFHSNILLRSLPSPRNLIHLSWTLGRCANSSFLGESMREENFYGSLDSYSLSRRNWREKRESQFVAAVSIQGFDRSD